MTKIRQKAKGLAFTFWSILGNFWKSQYIWYNTAAHVVNIIIKWFISPYHISDKAEFWYTIVFLWVATIDIETNVFTE
jgi:hypothetical protein